MQHTTLPGGGTAGGTGNGDYLLEHKFFLFHLKKSSTLHTRRVSGSSLTQSKRHHSPGQNQLCGISNNFQKSQFVRSWDQGTFMEESKAPSWKQLFLEVLVETNKEKLTKLVHDTGAAILLRWQELTGSSDIMKNGARFTRLATLCYPSKYTNSAGPLVCPHAKK